MTMLTPWSKNKMPARQHLLSDGHSLTSSKAMLMTRVCDFAYYFGITFLKAVI